MINDYITPKRKIAKKNNYNTYLSFQYILPRSIEK